MIKLSQGYTIQQKNRKNLMVRPRKVHEIFTHKDLKWAIIDKSQEIAFYFNIKHSETITKLLEGLFIFIRNGVVWK